ncbi:MAG: peptidase T [Promethearchaeota archaeon]
MTKLAEGEVVERFLRYVKIHTTSAPDIETIPSTKRQFNLANLLFQELIDLGIKNVKVTENCVVLATVESNIENSEVPCICLNAHLDTAAEESGENVHPKIIEYKGDDITLNVKHNSKISVKDNPQLGNYIGTPLITTDGTTLLGADDKAGIAEIMTAISTLTKDPTRKHGKIKILFTPDEEVGNGSKSISIDEIGADFAYTIDGGEMGNLEIECFNAASGTILIEGHYVHEGWAYGKMVNSLRIIPKILKLFPKENAPETTRGYEHYFHPFQINGDVKTTEIKFLLRHFDEEGLENQIQTIKDGIRKLKNENRDAKISVKFKKSYRNMKKILDSHPEVVNIAKEAIERTGLKVIIEPIRGGTDGAQFTYNGMPTPNIFTGGFNFHTKYEFIPVIGMKKAVEDILNIVDLTVEKYNK